MRSIRDYSPLILACLGGIGLAVLDSVLGGRLPTYLVLVAAGLLVLLILAGTILVQAIWFALMDPDKRRQRLRVFQTNYGRGAGWYVERDCRRLALLTEPRFEDMFWESYHVESLSDDPAESQRILSDRNWWLQPGLVYRSREFDAVAPTAFPAGRVFTESGRVVMRALYIYIETPNLFERLWLRFRR